LILLTLLLLHNGIVPYEPLPPEIGGGEGRLRQEEIARRKATWPTCD
jgi:hypothetical protein